MNENDNPSGLTHEEIEEIIEDVARQFRGLPSLRRGGRENQQERERRHAKEHFHDLFQTFADLVTKGKKEEAVKLRDVTRDLAIRLKFNLDSEIPAWKIFEQKLERL